MRPPPALNPEAVLGISAPVTHDELRAAYLREALRAYPAPGGSDAEFQSVVAAFEAVSRDLGPSEGLDSASVAGLTKPRLLSHEPQVMRSDSELDGNSFLAMMHMLLRALSADVRRKVIAKWMTESQRRALEGWMLRQQSHAEACSWTNTATASDAKMPCQGKHSCFEWSLNDPCGDFGTGLTSGAATRRVVRDGNCYLATVYTKWLEIRGPLRHALEDAIRDHAMLVDIKQLVCLSPDAALAEVSGWRRLTDMAQRHARVASELRARVMLPADFWVGTRLATPHMSLHEALRVWCQLRSHSIWAWRRAIQLRRVPPCSSGPARATAVELWADFRAAFIRVSVRAGFDHARVRARLHRLEQRHQKACGGPEHLVLRRVARLLSRETNRLNLDRRVRAGALRACKRECWARGQERSVALRRRLREEKGMGMGAILRGGHGTVPPLPNLGRTGILRQGD